MEPEPVGTSLSRDAWKQRIREGVESGRARSVDPREFSKPCRCDSGWIFVDDEGHGSVIPCGSCSPKRLARWEESAPADDVLGPRNHLDHDRRVGSCPQCRLITGAQGESDEWGA